MSKNDQTSKRELVKRYLFFGVGLLITAFGTVCVTKANLGTSPITSIPYTVSIGFKPTLGMFNLAFSTLLVIIQLLLLRKDFPKHYYLQIPVSIVFSYFIDFAMAVMSWLQPTTYIAKIIVLLIGCVVIGIGVFTEIVADVVMLPGDCFVNSIAMKLKMEFGQLKVAIDVSLSALAALIGFILYHRLAGVREGTLISAILIGVVAKNMKKKVGHIPERFFVSDSILARSRGTVIASATEDTSVS